MNFSFCLVIIINDGTIYKLLITKKKSQTICENRTEYLRVSLEKARLPNRVDLAFLV